MKYFVFFIQIVLLITTIQVNHAFCEEQQNDDDDILDLLQEDNFMYDNNQGTESKSEHKIDPYEKWNRRFYKFNAKIDKISLEPSARGYRSLSSSIKDLVHNFFQNVSEPRNIINHFLQGNFKNMRISLARLMVNSTIGILGLVDIADQKFGVKYKENSFSDTLRHLNVKSGPYIVLPILGPSSTRETLGLLADVISNPIMYITSNPVVIIASNAIEIIKEREKYIDIMEEINQNSLDPYAKMRSVYSQAKP